MTTIQNLTADLEAARIALAAANAEIVTLKATPSAASENEEEENEENADGENEDGEGTDENANGEDSDDSDEEASVPASAITAAVASAVAAAVAPLQTALEAQQASFDERVAAAAANLFAAQTGTPLKIGGKAKASSDAAPAQKVRADIAADLTGASAKENREVTA